MNKRVLILIFSLYVSGCALPPADITGQTFVPEQEVTAIRFVKEGLRYMAKGRYLDAEIRFRKAEHIEPTSVPIQQNIAVSLLKQERYAEASDLFELLHKNDPISLPLMVWLGKAKYAEGERDAGINLLNRAYAIAVERDDVPQIAAITRSLSALYFAQGNEADAVCLSSTATTLSPSPLDVYRHVRLLNGLGFPQNAIDQLLYYHLIGVPKIREHVVLLALSLFAQGDNQGSLNSVKEAFLLTSDNPELDLTLKLLVYLNVQKLKEKGVEIEQDIVDDELFVELQLDPRLEGAMALYLPQNLLEQIAIPDDVAGN